MPSRKSTEKKVLLLFGAIILFVTAILLSLTFPGELAAADELDLLPNGDDTEGYCIFGALVNECPKLNGNNSGVASDQ